jgi:hypothetical protein
LASRRSPLSVIEPSGYASAAATDNRSGVSAVMLSREGRDFCIGRNRTSQLVSVRRHVGLSHLLLGSENIRQKLE